MFEWFLENWITITLVVGLIYVVLTFVENIVAKKRNKQFEKFEESKNEKVVSEVIEEN